MGYNVKDIKNVQVEIGILFSREQDFITFECEIIMLGIQLFAIGSVNTDKKIIVNFGSTDGEDGISEEVTNEIIKEVKACFIENEKEILHQVDFDWNQRMVEDLSNKLARMEKEKMLVEAELTEYRNKVVLQYGLEKH